MKIPRDMHENASNFKESNQKATTCAEWKLSDENKELPALKLGKRNSSAFILEPNATALIPPWIRNSLGLTEKGGKQNQKCIKTSLPTASEKGFVAEVSETKTDPDEKCSKNSFANPIFEVNIGRETDFPEDACKCERKITPLWKNKNGKHSNQYESNVLGLSKDKRIVRAVKSEVTSVDVVVPMEDHEEGKRKMRSRKTRNKTCKRIFIGGPNNEESFKGNSDLSCQPVDACSTSSVDPCDGKLLDSSRVLLLCGKSVVDSLTEEDESLLREMKNLPFDKEGIARPCNEMKCLDKPIKEGESEKSVKNEEREGVAETFKPDTNDIVPRDLRSKAKFEDSITNNILHRNSKLIEEERKYLEEIKRHYEKKKCNPKKLIKFSEELESEKLRQSHRSKDFEKERKKFKNDSDLLAIEKAVNETLKKFIELHNFQVPADMLTTMKTNIIQNLQSELSESTVQRISLESFFREQINTDIKKRNVQSLITGEGELKYLPNKRKTAHTFTGEENEVSRDVSEDEVKLPLREMINIEISEEQASVEPDDIRSLQKDFLQCLNSIRTQLDISGSKLCSVVLEKVDISNTVEKKLKIIHDFSRGVTECIKMCQKKLELGSPEGDNVRTSTKACDCRRSPLWSKAKVTCNQSSQTKEKRVVRNGTQTEWNSFPIGDEKHPDLVPGLYRIIKAQKELGRFFLCPEELVEESDVAARETFDGCHNPESDPFPGFLLQENMKSMSRETFRSERLPENSGKLCRTFNSDCLGLNTWDVTRRESKSTFMNFFTDALDTCRVEDDNKLKEERNEEVGEAEQQNSNLAEEKEKHTDNTENCHVGCVWLWNGEKMYPGVDLKVHVEDLLREKLREILSEVKIGGSGNSCRDNLMGSSIVLSTTLSKPEISRNDLELHKTQPNFCIDDELSATVDTRPFIFSGCRRENTNKVTEGKEAKPRENVARSVREVGTQDSQHALTSLSIDKLGPRAKFCQGGRPTKQRCKKQAIVHKARRGKGRIVKPFSFAENVGEAKKVKLELRESKGATGNTESVKECFSLISNNSSSSTIGPVRVKLIGIEVSKEKKSPSESDGCENHRRDSQEATVMIDEYPSKDMNLSSKDQPKRNKHWELIENVLNKVNQKEKDSLWNDIREFVKKKIGRDINDEGAREVCIEIEQDLMSNGKGKSSQEIVARGNYIKNESDVEVEVDLTLDDLERIVRHRQRKLKRSQKYHDQKKVRSKKSSSSATSEEISNEVLNCNDYGGAFDTYITSSEMRMLTRDN